ncbi:MAG TPA: hypothetical protein VIG54_08685 [Lysobacter sp.]
MTNYQAPSSPVDELRPARRGWPLVPRLVVAGLVSALLPCVLVLLAMQGVGARTSLWIAGLVPLPLLAAWAFLGRKRPASAWRSAAVLIGVVLTVLLSFLLGSVAITLATLLWQPTVVLPSPGG